MDKPAERERGVQKADGNRNEDIRSRAASELEESLAASYRGRKI